MNKTHFFITLFVLPVLFNSCASSAGLPARKKMPEFTGGDGIESPLTFAYGSDGSSSPMAGSSSFAFHTSNIDLPVGSGLQGFVYVPLPDPAGDSMAISLLQSFKPLALSLMTAWAQQQQRGIAIDVSSHGGLPVHRTDYILEKAGAFTIPVVIFWDQASASRVATLKAMVGELAAVGLNSATPAASFNAMLPATNGTSPATP